MYDIYENPWLLFSASIFVLVVVVMYRRMFPDKCRFWQLIIPFALMASAFGIDHFVRTDREKIDTIINQAIKSTVDKDMNLVSSLISPDFSGNMFTSKKDLINSLNRHLNQANVRKIEKRHNFIQVENATGTSNLRISVFMNPESNYAPSKTLIFIKLELEFEKIDDNWLVLEMQVISLNDNPLNFSN